MLCQYIRGQSSKFERDRSGGAQVIGRGLSGPSIGHEVEGNLLPLVKGVHAGPLDRADMNKHVFASAIRLNKAESLLNVEPLYSPGTHLDVLSPEDAHAEVGTRVFA
jgi:hypothetical protein